MQTREGDFNRRLNERLDLSLQIMLPDHNGNTINISSSGVYFEVITKDIEAFSPGTPIPILITAATIAPGYDGRRFKLKGKGLVVRNDIKNVTSRGNKLGVALEFTHKLNITSYES